jgi:hypothetical protein
LTDAENSTIGAGNVQMSSTTTRPSPAPTHFRLEPAMGTEQNT